MNTKLVISLALAGCLWVPAAGFAGDYTGEGTSSAQEFIKDSIVTAKIKAIMAKDKQVSALNIKVDTDKNGVVYLSGMAKSQAEVDRAVEIAREVEGVTAVENHIEIKPN